MRSKLHYYLRFIFGLTRAEIQGFTFLLILILAYFGLNEYQNYLYQKELDLNFHPTYYQTKLDSLLIKQHNNKNYFASKWNPYTYINRNREKHSFFTFPKEIKKSFKSMHRMLDINAADSLEWIALPGIGPAFAKRILAYREKLGGFYSVNQLKEVYGLDSNLVNSQLKYFQIGQGIYRKLSIQKTEWKDFRHPYLPYAQAKIFLAYRHQHPEIATFQELDKIQLLDKSVWNKLRPYLD
ncbi:helix-hairpin-helix domain-containing protein [Aquirufa sp. ROCK-SH2]